MTDENEAEKGEVVEDDEGEEDEEYPELDEDKIYEVLSSQRRRETINYLRDVENPVGINELAEYIAEIETGESPPPTDARKTVYVSLHQTHLPELDDLRIVDYDESSKEIHVDDSFQQVAIYMEVVPKTELSWSEYYLAVGIVGLMTFFAYALGAPLISRLSIEYWGILYLMVVALSALYQTVTRRSI